MHRLHLILFGLAALLSAGSTPAQDRPAKLKIGAVLALTGPAARWGRDSERSMNLALEDLRASGKDQGLSLIVEDSTTQAAKGVSAFNKLVELDHVQAVIGDVWTFLTLPLIPLADRAKVVLIAPSVVPASVPNPGEHFFTLGFKPESTEPALDYFFKINPHIKSAFIFCWDDPWGEVYLKTWLKSLEEHRIITLGKICNNDYNHDYRTDVAKAILSRPDVLFVPYANDIIVRLLRERNQHLPLFNTSNTVEVLRDGRLPWDWAQTTYYADWPPPEEFIQRFKNRYGEPPSVEGFNAYDALLAILQAAQENPGDILGALKQQKRAGLSGPLDFTRGFAANYAQAGLIKVVGRNLVRIGP